MNIKEVREALTGILQAQLKKDARGVYQIPLDNRRVTLLAGPEGIGKKSILQQVAEECGVGLVTFNMAHVTEEMVRGERRIEEKRIGGREYLVLDYTMSEIVAAVYDAMEKNDNRQGILFIEDIQLVCDGLIPLLWQLIQEKRLGRYRVPGDYCIILSMNVPAVYSSIRAFPVEASSRILRLDVEPDFVVWWEYADKQVLHPAVLSYLEQNPGHFFVMDMEETAVDFVTPAGWEDLSAMLYAYEGLGHEVSGEMILSYLGDEKIAQAFTAYLGEFLQVSAKYRLPEILAGRRFKRSIKKLQDASSMQRDVLLGWIQGQTRQMLREWYLRVGVMEEVKPVFADWEHRLSDEAGADGVWKDTSFTSLLADYEEHRQELSSKGGINKEQSICMDMASGFLQEESMNVFGAMTLDDQKAYEIVMQDFAEYSKGVKEQAEQIAKCIKHARDFIFEALKDEILCKDFEDEIYKGFYGRSYEKRNGENRF